MFQRLNVEKSRKLFCTLLIVYLILAEFFPVGIPKSNNNSAESAIPFSCRIEQVSGIISHAAFVKEESFSYRVESNIRTGRKRSTECERTIRVYLAGILLTSVIYILSQMLSRLFESKSLIKQRLSIIIYIHNKDGRKSSSLS